MKLLFLGPPGAGKGTQAQMAAKHLNIAHISTGDILRENIKQNTQLGKVASGYIEKGQLVPDSVMIDIVRDRLKKPDCANGFILDGFPRTYDQAVALKDVTDIDACVNFMVSDEEVKNRICGRRVCSNCGKVYHERMLKGSETCADCGGKLIIRKDDNEETVANRLQVYREQTHPLIEFYQNMGILKNIAADKDAQTVFKQLLKAIS